MIPRRWIPASLVALVAVWTPVGILTAGAAPAPVTCIAHRGGPTTHTEESVYTYSDALDDGIKVIDGDIRFTSTGYPMMLHDPDLRLFGAPNVLLANISQGQTQSYTSASGDIMASLYNVFQALRDHPGSRAELEIKETTMTPAKWNLIHSRLDPVRDRVVLTSFSLPIVRQAQDNGFRTGYLVTADTESTGASMVAQDYTTITPAHVAALESVGVVTEAWTADTETAWETLASEGVTTINTNEPRACIAWDTERRS